MRKKFMLLFFIISSGILFQLTGQVQVKPATTELRAPAYPLVTIDPYTSAWSTTDNLFDSPVKHWTGRVHPLIGAIRVDGKVYRFMGKEEIPWKTVVPMANEEQWTGNYTTEKPAAGWEKKDFNASSWQTGKGGFGSPDFQNTVTTWRTSHIWVRREFTISEDLTNKPVYLIYSHDDDMELYLNGKEIVNTGQAAKSKVMLKIDASLLNKSGKNVFAAHCHDRGGLSYLDFGIYTESDQKEVFANAAIQNKVSISATQTYYDFTCGPVNLKLQFVSPLLPSDLDLLSRPVNYVQYTVASNDKKKHNVQIYFEATPQWAVNENVQEVEVTQGSTKNIGYLKAGTTEQPVLKKKGDDVRIDWGNFYLATEQGLGTNLAIGDYVSSKQMFSKDGRIAQGKNAIKAKMNKSMPVMSIAKNLGEIKDNASTGYVLVAYDDIESIQYFGDNLKAWWTKNGSVSIDQALQSAVTDYSSVLNRCTEFDNKIWKETTEAGGKNYADLCILAFRQAIAAHKLVKDKSGNILFLSKENFSNGSIGTVDVTYPSAPLFLKYNPDLLKGMLNPIFYYSESGKWTKPFAAHDVGTYPLANGQTYGGDMPVEECGNMLILTTAIAKAEGNANYAEKHWEVLTTWANYLLENGLDPENQLCTDDFAGHFAHNTNLSIKAIMGIAGYGSLAKMLGKTEIAEKYTSQAKEMAAKWSTMANDGDHYRLTFDQPGTWSQKYNLVWDKLLGFNIFPQEIAQKEIAYYLKIQNKYGLPLDNRKTYTKSDWIIWTATLSEDEQTFQKFIDPLHLYVTETPDRVPMGDWYETTNATQVGFQARSVVGGYFIKLLKE